MKNLTRLTDPISVIERLVQSDSGSAGLPVFDGDNRQSELDLSSMVDLLRNIYEKRRRKFPNAMDSLRSAPLEFLEHSGPGRFANDIGPREQVRTPDHGKWSTVQQELRLWCFGDSTGGKFVVINEKDTPEVFAFECVRPIGVSPESWSSIDISLGTDTLELAPGEHGIVGVRVSFNEFRPANAKFEFCLDIRGASGGLVSKLWIEVTFPT